MKNPVWWAEIACAVILPVLAYFGVCWEEMTSWGTLGGLILEAAKNPVVVAAVVVSVFNALTDPTTAGLADSDRAMSYLSPHKDKGEL